MTEGVGLFCPLTLDFIYEGLQAFPSLSDVIDRAGIAFYSVDDVCCFTSR